MLCLFSYLFYSQLRKLTIFVFNVQKVAFPLDYSTTLAVIREAISAVTPAPVVVSEGANTMDNARWAARGLERSPSWGAGAWGSFFFCRVSASDACAACALPGINAGGWGHLDLESPSKMPTLI
jgi:hypothetical protein